ncbi:MAG: AAA family ATPase [Ardenticatenaceae bacterium]|nr:AAA family ATPase [Ardenticatenaceae bacterium]
MPLDTLPPEKLRFTCDPQTFAFETTADLPATTAIIGQPRGLRAIEFGISIQSEGYNIFIMGPVGTGRTTAIERFLQERTRTHPVPKDWVYVNNFRTPHQPRAIDLPAGEGTVLQARMSRLIATLSHDLPQAFDTEVYEQAVAGVRQEFEAQQNEMLRALQETAVAQGFDLVNTPSGLVVAPVRDGEPLPPQAIQQLEANERQSLMQQQEVLSDKLDDVLAQIRQLEMAARRRVAEIDRDVTESTIQHPFAHMREQYQEQEEVLLYLEEVRQDVLNQIDDFAPPEDDGERDIDLRRYEVNVLVDNSKEEGMPVIVEQNPTYYNLFGRIEYEMVSGVVQTDFTNIKCGSIHRANGGYLIMDAADLLQDGGEAWEALKRTLKAHEARIQLAATMDASQVLAKSLSPEPIPLNVKIVLVGNPAIYYMLYEQDEDFRTLFKVRADFDVIMPYTPENVQAYATFVATRCQEEGLLPFGRTAVAKVVEFGTRLAEHQQKLTTRFGAVADLLREASFWAGYHGRSTVEAADVQTALTEREHRANRMEEEAREDMLEGLIFIATEGDVIGQVNGLSVLDTGEHAFGQPGRITARTYMGESGVVHIERETDMSGPIHQKGVYTLIGYLGGTYAQHQPLTLAASLTFEQTYSGVDGDSASSTELYALLSSLSDLPVHQGRAVTGSVNQRGEIQPIGGVNEKIEGFFRLCEARGLTGEQGVLIPASNAVHLMLHEDVVTAVAANQFHIWPVRTIDEGIELLTGTPAGQPHADGTYPKGTVHEVVHRRLLALAQELKSFGDDEEESEEEEL